MIAIGVRVSILFLFNTCISAMGLRGIMAGAETGPEVLINRFICLLIRLRRELQVQERKRNLNTNLVLNHDCENFTNFGGDEKILSKLYSL